MSIFREEMRLEISKSEGDVYTEIIDISSPWDTYLKSCHLHLSIQDVYIIYIIYKSIIDKWFYVQNCIYRI